MWSLVFSGWSCWVQSLLIINVCIWNLFGKIVWSACKVNPYCRWHKYTIISLNAYHRMLLFRTASISCLLQQPLSGIRGYTVIRIGSLLCLTCIRMYLWNHKHFYLSRYRSQNPFSSSLATGKCQALPLSSFPKKWDRKISYWHASLWCHSP